MGTDPAEQTQMKPKLAEKVGQGAAALGGRTLESLRIWDTGASSMQAGLGWGSWWKVCRSGQLPSPSRATAEEVDSHVLWTQGCQAHLRLGGYMLDSLMP